MKKNYITAIFLISISCIAVYSNSLKNPFVWDDEILIARNSYIRSFNNISKILTSPLVRSYRAKTFFYRPIQELSYALDFHFWKLNPFGYHLTNTLLHMINAIFIFFIIKEITKEYLISLFTSLLFTVHPIHTQAVTYISGRADLLAAFFLLLSFLCYIKSLYILSFFPFLLALFSKEYTIIFPLILIFYNLTFNKEKLNLFFWVKNWFPFTIFTFIYLYYRSLSLKFYDYKLGVAFFEDLLLRIFSIGKVIFIYFGLLIYPANLHMERFLSLPQSFLEISYLLSFIGLLAIIALLFISYKRSKRVGFFLSWFFVFLLPMLNILKLDTLIAEHWVYLASVGIFTIFVIAFKNIIRTKFLFCLSLIFLIIFYGSFTIKRNVEWSDKILFIKLTLEAVPNSIRVNYLYGQFLLEEGLYPQAIVQFKKLIVLKPDESDSYNILGVAYLRNKNLKKAKSCFEESIKLDIRYADPLNNLGLIYLKENNDKLAYKHFQKALAINPKNLIALNNLGVCYKKMGGKDLAEKTWKQVISIDPLNQQARYNLRQMRNEINQ